MPDAGRTCLGCRQRRPRAELIRIVRTPEGRALFDPEGRIPGRGAWVCPAGPCLDRLAPGPLGHALRGPVTLDPAPDRRATLAQLLERRVANLLGMARKARALVVGPTGVKAMLQARRAALLLVATDQPDDTLQAWRDLAGPVPVGALFDAGALGTLAGREPIAAAVVCDPGFADAIRRTLDRWRAISPGSCDNALSMTDTVNGRRRRGAPRREEAVGR